MCWWSTSLLTFTLGGPDDRNADVVNISEVCVFICLCADCACVSYGSQFRSYSVSLDDCLF